MLAIEGIELKRVQIQKELNCNQAYEDHVIFSSNHT